MKHLLIVFIGAILLGCGESQRTQETSIASKSKLIDIFKVSNSGYPNISVHRGGKGLLHYPENCLETLQFINDSIYAVYEIDIAQTKDGKLVLMHDNSIERTTNGSGLVKDLTYNELKKYNLVDDYGNVTEFKIPEFSEVLKWCKLNKVILTVDIKRSVSQEVVIRAVKEAKAEDIVVIITYDVAQAKSAYNLAPELLLSVSARNHDEVNRLFKTKIPMENMLAFTGTRLSDVSLFQRLSDKNIVSMLGTLGNLDKQAEARGDKLYREWKAKGVNIIATDRPFEAFKAINN
ncbi:MAG: glycerophosphodiester phosphodiesterase family protein [Winogradskyella sp.]|nr:glycerophosphodiester phosphodiesterase family protein [Winogradskyella sp.]